MRVITITGLFIAALSLPSISQPEIFEWVDEKGIKHFSDKPRNNLFDKESADDKDAFSPLDKDIRPAKEKLRLLQGDWLQINSSPSLPEMTNLLASLWQMPEGQKEKTPEMKTFLNINGNRVSIENQASGAAAESNTYKEQPLKPHSSKLEFYNDIPLEVGGYWNFEQGFNPFITSFLEQVSPNRNPQKGSEQIRFDIQANKLMVTVKLPAELRVPLLKIIYEKQYGGIPSLPKQPALDLPNKPSISSSSENKAQAKPESIEAVTPQDTTSAQQ